MQRSPHYGDVVAEVRSFLAERMSAAEAAGVPRDLMAVDPGFGFGKTLAHNVTLLAELGQFVTLGARARPMVIGATCPLAWTTGRRRGWRREAPEGRDRPSRARLRRVSRPA